jgi:hypothetical protein
MVLTVFGHFRPGFWLHIWITNNIDYSAEEQFNPTTLPSDSSATSEQSQSGCLSNKVTDVSPCPTTAPQS